MNACICMKLKTLFRGFVEPFYSPTLFLPCKFSPREGFAPALTAWVCSEPENKQAMGKDVTLTNINYVNLIYSEWKIRFCTDTETGHIIYFIISTSCSLWALLMTFTCSFNLRLSSDKDSCSSLRLSILFLMHWSFFSTCMTLVCVKDKRKSQSTFKDNMWNLQVQIRSCFFQWRTSTINIKMQHVK